MAKTVANAGIGGYHIANGSTPLAYSGSSPPHNPVGTAVTPTFGFIPSGAVGTSGQAGGCSFCDSVTSYWWVILAVVIVAILLVAAG